MEVPIGGKTIMLPAALISGSNFLFTEIMYESENTCRGISFKIQFTSSHLSIHYDICKVNFVRQICENKTQTVYRHLHAASANGRQVNYYVLNCLCTHPQLSHFTIKSGSKQCCTAGLTGSQKPAVVICRKNK